MIYGIKAARQKGRRAEGDDGGGSKAEGHKGNDVDSSSSALLPAAFLPPPPSSGALLPLTNNIIGFQTEIYISARWLSGVRRLVLEV